MVYIPYPRVDLNNHPDLVAWRMITNKKEGDWKQLKNFLADSARIINDIHPISKCWYSELPQGDNIAKDVEHFRPKNEASPLNTNQINDIQKNTGLTYEQDSVEGSYNWLEFDYRNYRIVSAVTNRGGAKHIYFPIVKKTKRLLTGKLPWLEKEYPYFLDPTNKHDTSLLFVKPNGEIAPLAVKTQLTNADFDNLPTTWTNDGFNYLRSIVTIKLYRLDDNVFVQGRKEVYDKISRQLNNLVLCIQTKANRGIKENIISDIFEASLPSAPFSLAAKCALKSYLPLSGTSDKAVKNIKKITIRILSEIQIRINSLQIDWNKP
jgi:hypothetical protein